MNSPALPLTSQLALLPEAWELVDTFQEQASISGVAFRMVGYAARRKRDQLTVTGSSCGWDRDPADTAWYELLERISLVTARSLPMDTRWCLRHIKSFAVHRMASSQELFKESPQPQLWTPAKSNGVAMGQTWQKAVQHALHEVIERHLVLASWYGAVKPQLVPTRLPLNLSSLQHEFRIEHYHLGEFICDENSVRAAATFIWPLNGKKPVIYGFGADAVADDATERSLKEALQRLCFLHDAEEPEAEAAFKPTADFHQDYFLQPAQQMAIKGWLAGDHFQERYAQALAFQGESQWLDLTPHDNFPGKVVQVFLPGSLALMFGRYQPPQFPDLDPKLLIHPIM